jgi:hypothetical protein
MVIQPRATQALVVPREAHRLNDMQAKTGVGAQSDDVAGIGWYFWFE